METLKTSSDTLFILLGAIMVLAMHAGLRLPRTRHGAQEEPGQCAGQDPGRLLGVDDRVLLHRLRVAYGVNFFAGAETLAQKSGYELVKFFFLLTFAAAIPAIVSGGIAERARFNPQLAATVRSSSASSIRSSKASRGTGTSASRLDQRHVRRASSTISPARVVVHAVGGWIGAAPRCCCSARGAAATARTARHRRASAVEHSVPRARRLGAVRWAGSAST